MNNPPPLSHHRHPHPPPWTHACVHCSTTKSSHCPGRPWEHRPRSSRHSAVCNACVTSCTHCYITIRQRQENNMDESSLFWPVKTDKPKPASPWRPSCTIYTRYRRAGTVFCIFGGKPTMRIIIIIITTITTTTTILRWLRRGTFITPCHRRSGHCGVILNSAWIIHGCCNHHHQHHQRHHYHHHHHSCCGP